MDKIRRGGLTLIELLVVMTMLGILLALLMPAIQKVRQASKREACAEKLMQIGQALHNYHDTFAILPPGLDSSPPPPQGNNVNYYWSWMGRILPFIGEDELWRQADDYARTVNPDPWEVPGNPALGTPLDAWQCPADPRQLVTTGVTQDGDLTVAFTDYQGVSGTHSFRVSNSTYDEGVLFANSRIRFGDITNGLSNVLMVGERPPNEDLIFGWWFAGFGQDRGGSGSLDVVLGVSEQNVAYGSRCSQGVGFQFMPGDLSNPCDDFHYWSLHHHGANFLLADGSVHFFKYTIDPAVLIAMAYRSGGPP